MHLCLKSCINDKNQLYPPTLNHNNIDAKKVIVRHFNARGIGDNNTAFVPGNFFYKRNAVDKTKEKQR